MERYLNDVDCIRKTHGAIFDMDGCLLDSIKIWHESERRITDDAGIVLTKEQRDRLNALTLEEAAQFFHDEFGIGDNWPEVAQAIIGHMLAFYSNEAEANPGAVEYVRSVHASDSVLCVLSSSPQAFLQAGLAHANLIEFFDPRLIISAEDEGLAKRDPRTFLQVCERMRCEPQDTCLYDDSWYALASARKAGLKTVGVFSDDNCGTHEELAAYADIVVDDFNELLD